ncbi:unnamed protein product [Paramecium pentaurelia]|nr:unnamed protein product [Paramecium pentaurelia]
MIRLDEDFHQLMELFEQKEFQENYYIPTSFHQYNYLIEKLKKHSFKLIDLIEQCQYSSFQLNSTILSHLVFFFFIPEELQINSREKMELYQLLGEITCECWLQFEYHIQQLKFTQQDQNKLKILSEIPQLFQIDLQTLKNSIYQILQMQ